MPINELYFPEKYKVIIGKGENVGFCTVWNDPEIVLKMEPKLLDHVAILGTLYSREGINIMIRNLCLNPQITYLFVWGKGHLSKTQIGMAGKNILERIWNGNLSDDSLQDFKLHPTIDTSVVRNVIQNVKLIDVSDLELKDAFEKLKKVDKKKPYMKPVSFPEYKREFDTTFPSEEVGFVVRGKNIIDAWIKVLDKIMRYGTIKPTEYGNQQRELQVITWVIEDEDVENIKIPDWPKHLKKIINLEKESLEKYMSTIFFDPVLPEGIAYTYGNRLMAYPEREKTTNQVEYMINKIKECPSTRRAVSVLFHPFIDKNSKSPPCLTQIQILVNEGKLNMFAVYRSQDIFKAGIPNAFGLRALQKHIAKETGYETGKLSITTNSAHVYEEDWDNAKKLCMCEIWERPIKLTFDPVTESDPRVNVIINVVKDKIVAD
ncbi:MAG: thymidylate synthase, partial [Fervidobacterium sp.]